MTEQDTLFLHIRPLAKEHCVPLHQRFTAIKDTPYSLFLDSAGSEENANKYSLIMWEPSAIVLQQSNRTVLIDSDTHRRVMSRNDPFTVIDELLSDLSSVIKVGHGTDPTLVSTLPFHAGVAGLIGYDASRNFVPLTSQKNNFYTPDIAVGLYTQALIHCHTSGNQFLCCLTKEKDFTVPDIDSLLPISELGQFSLETPWRANMSEDEYCKALNKVSEYLVAGDCYQINYSQQFSASFSGDTYSAYCLLREHNRAPFSAYMTTEHGAILSVSPERFISARNNQVETKPIKGTRPRFTDPVEDEVSSQTLLSSEKDRAENLMIVDLLRNDLSKHCQPNTVKVPKLFALESYSAVHHMVSTVVGELKPDSTPLQLLKDAFPGGSITGAPKVRAMEIIDELEPHKRNLYCGSVFYCGWKKDMDSSICIRTLIAEDETLYCCAGGGIVLDSKPTDEYQETLDKVAKILPVLESHG